MNQYALFNFVLLKNDRPFQIMLQPGTPFEDVQEVLEEFKKEFIQLQAATEERIKAEQEKIAADTQAAS